MKCVFQSKVAMTLVHGAVPCRCVVKFEEHELRHRSLCLSYPILTPKSTLNSWLGSATCLTQPFKLQPFENNLSTNVVLLVGIGQWDWHRNNNLRKPCWFYDKNQYYWWGVGGRGRGGSRSPINNIDINHKINMFCLSCYSDFNPIGLFRPIARHLLTNYFQMVVV